MNFRNYLALFGALLVVAGGMSPMIRVPVMGNWNYWDIDPVLASIVLVLAGSAILGAVLRKPGVARFSGWGIVIVVLFTLIAVFFKVNDYFSFIPFKKLARRASNLVQYKWVGWTTLFCGALILIFSSTVRQQKIN